MLMASHILRIIQAFLPQSAFRTSDSQAQVMRFAQESVVREVFDLHTQPRKRMFLQIRANGIQPADPLHN